MNLRMPNGMYGGVRGGLNSPYSISYIEFIAYTVDAFHIIRQFRGNPDFLSQVAYMIVDCLSGIVGEVLMPD